MPDPVPFLISVLVLAILWAYVSAEPVATAEGTR